MATDTEALPRERVTCLTARDVGWLLNILDKPPQPPTGKLQRALKHFQMATRGDSNRAFDWRARSGSG
jgi:uncharacterized protein (DUF1778 family)